MENVEYEIAKELWLADIRSVSELEENEISNLQKKYDFCIEEVDSIILDNWGKWNEEMPEDFKVMIFPRFEYQDLDL